ncbi:hypothetical protein DFP72DRAFT_8560 [Ephemerocybe angulata]|uniref:Uncharacterized protein n=1 Tax=Ephemerocybe angulata TaxID=980116 RepID=A0A8H6II69_9AGAR|nr:hypothetical protein DFP72DRAFT_8560 [Tulosesus angulatus]
MSDATGVTAGGITDLLQVKAPTGGSSCNTTDPGADFFFSTESALVQCQNYPFTTFDRAIQPVTIYGFEPKGSSLVLPVPAGSTDFNWKADFPSQSRIIFYMSDARGRNGGCSPVNTVGPSADASCVASRPGTTTTSGTKTGTKTGTSQTPSKTGGTSGDSSSGGKSSNLGAIIGGAVGGVVVLGILAFFIIFCLRRKRARSNAVKEPKLDLSYDPTVKTSAPLPSSYLLPGAYNHSNSNLAPAQATGMYAQASQSSQGSQGYAPSSSSSTPLNPAASGGEVNPRPPLPSPGGTSRYSSYTQSTGPPPQPYGYGAGAAAAAGGAAGYYQHQGQQQPYPQQYGNQYPQQHGYTQNSTASGGGSSFYTTNADNDAYDAYGGIATHQPQYPPGPARHAKNTSTGKSGAPPPAVTRPVVVHQDIEDTMEELPEELPPQYSESRAPIPGFPSSHGAGGSGGSSQPQQMPLRDRKG